MSTGARAQETATPATENAPAKSPRAFRTISEVSEDLDLPQHVLRFWETRFTQIKPLKRGGGRRLYRPDHVALLRGIKALLYDDGMTIKGVQKVLRDQGPKSVVARGENDSSLAIAAPEVPADASERLRAIRERAAGAVQPGAAEGTETGIAALAADEIDPAVLRRSIARLEELLAKLESA